VLHAGNDHVDTDTDPGYRLGEKDTLALLAPGPTTAFADDVGIAFGGEGAVSPASFGILADGVTRSTCGPVTDESVTTSVESVTANEHSR
jgi:hypothetical protein